LFSAAAVHKGLDLTASLERVLHRQWYVLGEEVTGFEDEFASYVGTTHCAAVANGTDALELALRAVGVRAGDRVLCAANAGFYGSTACIAAGARPVYGEIDPDTLCLSPAAVEEALANGAAAVILTHLYGQVGAVEAIANLCRTRGVPLIEDCAQAHGARHAGARAGSFGDVGCFSFYPTKNLGALGDGGAVVTSRADVDQSVRSLRQYGWSRKYVADRSGGRNSRLDEMQAAVLRDKLPALDTQNQARREVASRYNAAFSGLPLACPPSLKDD
jgi:dTDP-4-amino-4,6-dideoxygalactose transaminase